MIPLLHLSILAGIWLLLWAVSSTVYNLYLHPLSRYPGPLLAKLTGWYEHTRVGKRYHHVWLYEMHEKYGPVVRIAPNRLSFNTTEALHNIYGDRKGNVRKAGFTEVIAALKGGARNLQTINDRHTYGPRRRLVAHAFSEDALQSSTKYVLEHVRAWCDIITSKVEKPSAWTEDVDMKHWSTLVTEDILADLCFGEPFGVVQKGVSEFGQLIEEGCAQVQQICWMPIAQGLCRVMKPVIDYGRKNRWTALKPQLDYDESIDSKIERRLASDNDARKDFLHYVLQAKDAETGEVITPAEMTMEAGVLFGAGVDTSAVTISACLFYLIRYPEALAKVTAEIRNTYSDVEEITYDAKLKSLDYLRACIDETLRISPPVPGGLLREVIGDGITINNNHILPGTEVIVPMYAIHHNETYFPDPWTFNPERFLNDSEATNKDAFCPFSYGPRMCVGYRLAYLDMTVFLARLLFLFDVRQAPGNTVGEVKNTESMKFPSVKAGKVEYSTEDIFVTHRNGPIVQFRMKA